MITGEFRMTSKSNMEEAVQQIEYVEEEEDNDKDFEYDDDDEGIEKDKNVDTAPSS